MSKPTELFGWLSLVNSQAPPDNTLKHDGFTANLLPASFMNWLTVNLTLWIAWLNDYENTAHIWNAAQTLNYVLNLAGSGGNGRTTLADALGAVLSATIAQDSVSNRSLIYVTNPKTGSTVHGRLWFCPGAANVAGTFEWTVNANYDGTVWSKDDTSKTSTIFTVGIGTVLQGAQRASGAGTWADTYNFTAGSAGWNVPLFSFGGLGGNGYISSNLQVVGSFDAGTGANRAEFPCHFESYTTSPQGLQWSGTYTPLPRMGNGLVTDWTVFLAVTPPGGQPITFTLSRDDGTLHTLSTIVITNPATKGSALGLSASYNAGDALRVVATHPGAPMAAHDLLAVVRTRE